MSKRTKSLILLAAVAMLLFVGCRSVSTDVVGKSQKPATDTRSIVILYENDVHCAIDGYAKMAGLCEVIADTAYAVMVSCGDFLQGGAAGALSKGEYVIDIMNSVGYDAMTLGNHEFDYKMPRLQELAKKLNAPITCVNLKDVNSGRIVFPLGIVKTYGKRKVGFIGVTTPTALQTEKYAFFDEDGKQTHDLCPDEVYALVQSGVNMLREQGADYVVVLSHLGEEHNDTNVDSHGLISATTGIDVLLDGHTHSVVPSQTVRNKAGEPVLVSQTGTAFTNVGKLLIRQDGRVSTELVPIADISQVNARVKHTTDSIKSLLREQTEKVICESDVELKINDAQGRQQVRFAETNTGDLVADAFRVVSGAQIGINNGGGIRVDLPKGQLNYGQIISLLPFLNYICVVEVTGAQLENLLSQCTRDYPAENGDFPQVSGVKFTVNVGKTPHITNLVVLDKNTNEYVPVEPEKRYTLATTDYCITGGGFKGLLKKNKVIRSNILHYNDCFVKYVTEHLKGRIGNEYAEPQGRIIIKE